MAGDYIPHSDVKFKSWAQEFMKYVEAHAGEIGLKPEELAELQAEQAEFDARYTDHYAAHRRAKAACAAKDAAKRHFTKSIRSVAMRMQKTPAVDKAGKRGLGLSTGEPDRNPVTAMSVCTPVALIDIGDPLKHVLRIRNRTPDGIRMARAVGARGCEIWAGIGDASNLRLVSIVMRNKCSMEYTQADAGKQVYYRFRWVSADGSKGPWSGTQSATVAA